MGRGGGEERDERFALPHGVVNGLWLVSAGLCFCFRERAVGDRALLNVRLASSGSDANVCASGNQLYRSVWLWSDTRKLLDEFLAAGNTLARLKDVYRTHATAEPRRLPRFPRPRVPETPYSPAASRGRASSF